MHRTETVDYVIVIDGEIEMDMDDSTVKLKAGDIMVQRGTNHAWANRSGKRARVAFVLVDAEPLGIGKPVLGTTARVDRGNDHDPHRFAALLPRSPGLHRRERADLSERPDEADRADLAGRRDRHHGAHRGAAADRVARPERHRRQPAGGNGWSARMRWRLRSPTG